MKKELKKRICPVCGRIHKKLEAAEKCYETALGIAEFNFQMNSHVPFAVQRSVIEVEQIINQLS